MVLLYAVALVLLVVCLVDLVQAPPDRVRTLPKPLWFLVVLPPLLGPAAWLLVGRPSRAAAAPAAPSAPDDDEDFLRELRRRAQEQRRRSRDPRDD